MSDTISVELIHDRTVNLAVQQNRVPVVKRLRVSNEGDESLANVTVGLSAEPEFAQDWSVTLASLPEGATVDVGAVDLRLSPAYLAGLTERVEGTLKVTVSAADGALHSEASPISVLAFDEWNGLQTLPYIIAAFVTPNDPEVAAILRAAADTLGGWTGNPSLNAYQSKDPNRARLQVAAIYTAIQRMEIAYCVPPPSFEEQGQRIRTPDVIRETKLGTCLDLAVLFAACIEAVGLHPLLIFLEGHAFPGAWLVEETFSEAVQDDVTLLTKRVAPGVREIAVVEATVLTAGQNCPFEEAVRAGEAHLGDPDKFHYFVDIRRARASGIRPLPSRPAQRSIAEAVDAADASPASAPEALEATTTLHEAEGPAIGRSRLEQWERRLLDLSLRNPLLNFRPMGANLPLLAPDLTSLEDALADGEDFQVLPRPADWAAAPRDPGVYRRRANDAAQLNLLRAEFAQRRLRADLTDHELALRLTDLYRSARTSMEENGANTLYLALGLLAWYESNQSETPRYSPILLVPMEIVRRSVQTGYVIRKSEDDPVLNVTLLEMLRQDRGVDIAGLDDLPRDEHGVDVHAVLSIIRRAVMNESRWDVVDDAYLGHFTFSKFVMWHDLKARSEELKDNPLVASLMSGALTWTPGDDFPAPSGLDAAYHPKEVFSPLGADAHQLAAVIAAGEGKTFILHGPPGTGKSHTITNIIAHALAHGKSVLFVAEKMAALNVVQRNLASIGLDPFCLEVHSNKSKKAAVLRQLDQALKAAASTGRPDWQAEADRLASLRGELNAYVEALHRRRAIGHSVFDGLSRYSGVRHAPDVVSFDVATVSALTPERLREWADQVRRLRVAGRACGRLIDHPWALSRQRDYTPALRSRAAEALGALGAALDRWRGLTAGVAELFHAPGEEASFTEQTALLNLAKRFMAAPAVSGAMVRCADWEEARSAVDAWIGHGRTRDALRAELRPRYTDRALALDVAALQESLRQAEAGWFMPRWLGFRSVAKALRATMQPGCSPDMDRLAEELDRLQRWVAEEGVLSAAGDRARDLLGRLWGDGEADWDAVAGATRWAAEVRQCAAAIAGTDLARLSALREHWGGMLNEYREQLSPDGPLGQQLAAFADAGDAVEAAWRALAQLLSLEAAALAPDQRAPGWFAGMRERLDRWTQGLDELRDWCAWVRTRSDAQAAGLAPVIAPYEQGLLSHDQVEAAFERGLYQTWAEKEIEGDPLLANFAKDLFEDKIRQFRRLDKRFADLTRQEVYARLASRVPRAGSETAPTSEMGILRNQIQRQRGHMALRELFQRIPNLLSRLTPCLLMSPISVAQYLDPAHPKFDLVIFDEASQVPTWDAVGAIARGAQAVIVGDPKQLPPTSTSFFSKASASSAEPDSENIGIEDLDSILEDCITLSVPEEHLLWHYRSRHESLIAFSNHNYYENRLITFPSPDDQTAAVHWRPIAGTYGRGGSKQNRAEAEAVAEDVVRRLSDNRTASQSIGIVTFNQPQQQLIEDLLDEQMRQHPELEALYANGPDPDRKPEPVFVKNLENVQGDERDVILLSVGYGADATGRVAMNFGPLNREGGWRRLNVIVSRARMEMVVFSSLRADQLDLSRSSARGVADLRAFLEYAEKGRGALLRPSSGSADAGCESVFEEQVCRALKEKGHTVHAQVGCSGYRIDLAIVDPDRPGRYLLGVECDGASYHSAKTARDRDKLREDVLRGLGWTLHRVWSTDWWESPKREIERIEEALAAARVGAEAPPDPPESTEAVRDRPMQPIAGFVPFVAPAPPEPASDARRTYSPCRLPQVARASEDFYLPYAISTIIHQVEQVVNEEGPISFALLSRRVVNAWGMTRLGARIDQRLREACTRSRLLATKSGGAAFYWPRGADPAQYAVYRVPGADDLSRRSAEDLPPEEIANAARDVLRAQISLPEDDLIREIARLFGYQRTGVKVDQALRRGVALLVAKGLASKDADGRIVSA